MRNPGIVALFLAACTEPTEAGTAPTEARHPPVTQPAQPTVPPAHQAIPGSQRYLQAPLDAAGLARRPTLEPLAQDSQLAGLDGGRRVQEQLRRGQQPSTAPQPGDEKPLQPGAPSLTEIRAVLATVQGPLATRNFDALQPMITQRLFGTLQPLQEKNGDRLWRHLARYPLALQGRLNAVVDDVQPNHVQLKVALPDGGELRPVLEKVDGVWKIDRF